MRSASPPAAVLPSTCSGERGHVCPQTAAPEAASVMNMPKQETPEPPWLTQQKSSPRPQGHLRARTKVPLPQSSRQERRWDTLLWGVEGPGEGEVLCLEVAGVPGACALGHSEPQRVWPLPVHERGRASLRPDSEHMHQCDCG